MSENTERDMPVGFLRQRRNALLVASTLWFMFICKIKITQVSILLGAGTIGNKDGILWCLVILLIWLTIRFWAYFFANGESFLPLEDVPRVRDIIEGSNQIRAELFNASQHITLHDEIIDYYLNNHADEEHAQRLIEAVRIYALVNASEKGVDQYQYMNETINEIETLAKESGGWSKYLEAHEKGQVHLRRKLTEEEKTRANNKSKLSNYLRADRVRIITDAWLPGIYITGTTLIWTFCIIKEAMQ